MLVSQPIKHSHVVSVCACTDLTSAVLITPISLEQHNAALQAGVTATKDSATIYYLAAHSFPAEEDCIGLMIGKLACRPLTVPGTSVQANYMYSCIMSYWSIRFLCAGGVLGPHQHEGPATHKHSLASLYLSSSRP